MRRLTFNDLSLERQKFLKSSLNRGNKSNQILKQSSHLNFYIHEFIVWRKSNEGPQYWVKTYQKVETFNEFLNMTNGNNR